MMFHDDDAGRYRPFDCLAGRSCCVCFCKRVGCVVIVVVLCFTSVLSFQVMKRNDCCLPLVSVSIDQLQGCVWYLLYR